MHVEEVYSESDIASRMGDGREVCSIPPGTAVATEAQLRVRTPRYNVLVCERERVCPYSSLY